MFTGYKLLLLMCFLVSDISYIQLKEFYKGNGVIFSKKIDIPFKITGTGVNQRFTPSIKEVVDAETVLLEKYNSMMISDSKVYSYKYKPVKNVKRKLYKYNRQYIGYLNENGDRIMYIRLLNFSKRRKAVEYFEGWKCYPFSGSGAFYEENMKTIHVNITKKTLSRFSL